MVFTGQAIRRYARALSMRPRSTIALAASLVSIAAPTSAAAAEDPAGQPPFGGERPPELVEPASTSVAPQGFVVAADEAIELSAATEAVRDELAETPDAAPSALIRGERWQVGWFDPGGREVAQVIVDGRTGEIDEAWRDFQVGSELARGYEGAIAQAVNSPWVWLGLSRPLHRPVLRSPPPVAGSCTSTCWWCSALGLSLLFFNRAEITASVALTYPVLGYLLVEDARRRPVAARAAGEVRIAGPAGAGAVAGRRGRGAVCAPGSRSTSSTRR